LYYAQFIGAVYRYMRDPRRDLSRKTILMFDEFGLAMQIESVLDLTMTISKVARKYGIALCVADQLPITFLANVKARNILDNARIKVIFHLGELPAREISTAFPQLAPEHLAFITQPNKGECVIIMDQLTVPVVVEPTPRELALLTGS
jgi:type IV secretory pathway VirB4 component